jgi:hypothetical protein
MRNRKSGQAVALLLLALPILGGTCTEEKAVDLVIGFPTTVRFQASGSTNQVTFQSAGIDLVADLDIEAALDDAGVDVNDIDTDAATRTTDIKVSQVFYRVIVPDAVANRQIVNADLRVGRVDAATQQIIGGGTGQVLIQNWCGNAGVGNVADPQAWIDVTNLLASGAPGTTGLDPLNDYLYDLVIFLQTGTPVPNPEIKYAFSGQSTPTGSPTLFEYEVKIVFQGVITETFEVPFG